MKTSNRRKNARIAAGIPKPEPVCPNCGRPGRHYVPPSLGEPGFFACPEPITGKP